MKFLERFFFSAEGQKRNVFVAAGFGDGQHTELFGQALWADDTVDAMTVLRKYLDGKS